MSLAASLLRRSRRIARTVARRARGDAGTRSHRGGCMHAFFAPTGDPEPRVTLLTGVGIARRNFRPPRASANQKKEGQVSFSINEACTQGPQSELPSIELRYNNRPPTATNQLRSGEHGLSESIRITPRAQYSTATTCRCASRVEGRSARKGHSQKQMPSNWKETNICNIGRFGCNSRQRLFFSRQNHGNFKNDTV